MPKIKKKFKNLYDISAVSFKYSAFLEFWTITATKSIYLGSHIMLWIAVGGESICHTCCDLRRESGKDLRRFI